MPSDEDEDGKAMKKKRRREASGVHQMFEIVTRRLVSLAEWCARIRHSYAFARLQSRWKFWKRASLAISPGDQTYQTIYLGNVPTFWARGEQAIEAPLRILWKNYERRRGKKAPTRMKITICNTGMRVVTREVGEIEYWSNRITFVTIVPAHPRILFWIYRHTGKRGRPDLRCHAVLCVRSRHSREMADNLQVRLFNNMREFRKEISARAAATNHVLPVRKKFLVKGMLYFKQPLERSLSAPKLDAIREEDDDDEQDDDSNHLGNNLFCVSTGQLNL